jgi:hypothetical protein
MHPSPRNVVIVVISKIAQLGRPRIDFGTGSVSMPKMLCLCVGILISAVVTSSDALSQQSLEELERASQFEKVLAAVDGIKRGKRLQCVIAVGNGALCECLSRKLPVDIHFRSYAAIANQDKVGEEYVRLSAADKKIVDQCVIDNR